MSALTIAGGWVTELSRRALLSKPEPLTGEELRTLSILLERIGVQLAEAVSLLEHEDLPIGRMSIEWQGRHRSLLDEALL